MRCSSTSPTRSRSGCTTATPCGCESATGALDGHVKVVRLPSRSLQVHWPEGNVLVAGGPDHREPGSKVPAYEAVVTIRRR